MANTQVKIVTLGRLTQYDGLIKSYIGEKITDGAKDSLKSFALVTSNDKYTLNFYKEAKPVDGAIPAFTADIPKQDLSGLIKKIQNATAGDVVIANADGTVADGGVKLTDLAKTADVTTAIGNAKDVLAADIKKNTDAIAKLNGTENTEGSVAKAVNDAKVALQEQITANKKVLDKLDGADTVDGSVKKQIKDAKEAVEAKIGTMDDLKTAEKATVVGALNEVKNAVDAVKTTGEVTVDTTTTTEGMAKSYTLKQNNKTIATIDIPKDMVVKSGAVEKDPVGQAKGTYLVLTLANATEDKIYINVGTLVDIYVAKANADQVQVTIDPTTREISAAIVAGSVGTTELADGAVTTTKIADGNVTKAKLSTELQDSIDKANSAIQESDLTALKADVAANKASLAEGGATANAIKANKEAAAKAQSNVDALAARVSTIESVEYVEATEDEIKALFTAKAE